MANTTTENNSASLFRAWAIAYAKETYGYDVSENDAVELNAVIEGDGCCEMCYSESATIDLTVGKYNIRIGNYFTV